MNYMENEPYLTPNERMAVREAFRHHLHRSLTDRAKVFSAMLRNYEIADSAVLQAEIRFVLEEAFGRRPERNTAHLPQLDENIKSLLTIPKGALNKNSRAIDHSSLANLLTVVSKLEIPEELPPIQLVPLLHGGVQAEWLDGDHFVEVEVHPSGLVTASCSTVEGSIFERANLEHVTEADMQTINAALRQFA